MVVLELVGFAEAVSHLPPRLHLKINSRFNQTRIVFQQLVKFLRFQVILNVQTHIVHPACSDVPSCAFQFVGLVFDIGVIAFVDCGGHLFEAADHRHRFNLT